MADVFTAATPTYRRAIDLGARSGLAFEISKQAGRALTVFGQTMVAALVIGGIAAAMWVLI